MAVICGRQSPMTMGSTAIAAGCVIHAVGAEPS
jgi:hypothetical protein